MLVNTEKAFDFYVRDIGDILERHLQVTFWPSMCVKVSATLLPERIPLARTLSDDLWRSVAVATQRELYATIPTRPHYEWSHDIC